VSLRAGSSSRPRRPLSRIRQCDRWPSEACAAYSGIPAADEPDQRAVNASHQTGDPSVDNLGQHFRLRVDLPPGSYAPTELHTGWTARVIGTGLAASPEHQMGFPLPLHARHGQPGAPFPFNNSAASHSREVAIARRRNPRP
jgi:hypothetical protein